MKRFGWGAAAIALTLAAPAMADTVYSNDLDGGSTLASGVTLSGTLGGATLQSTSPSEPGGGGIAGNYLRNETNGLSELVLTGVGGYTAFDVNFTLAFIDSWDSTNGSPAPDYLNIFVNGTQVLQLTANNTSGFVTELGGGTQTLLGNVLYSGFTDRIVDMGTASALSFANTGGDTLRLGIQFGGIGFQGGADESWGIDDLDIQGTLASGAVPEPATWAMMIGGMGLAGGALRRRRTRTTLRFA